MNTDNYYSLCHFTVSAILNLQFFFVSVPSLKKTEKQFFPNVSIHKQVFKSLASPKMCFSVLKLVSFSDLLHCTSLMLALVQVKMLVIAYLVQLILYNQCCRIKIQKYTLASSCWELRHCWPGDCAVRINSEGCRCSRHVQVASLADAKHVHDFLFITLKF